MANIRSALVLICIVFHLGNAFRQLGQPCQPFGVHLNLGHKFYNESQAQMIGLRFNTRAECPESFAIVQKPFSFVIKVQCSTDSFILGSYTGYIHKCSISNLTYGDSFTYMAYGWEGINTPIPFEEKFIKTHVMSNRDQIKMVVLADWGFLKAKAGVYDPLDTAFKSMLDMEKKIDAIYIGGDIAYDLDSFEGQYYEDFVIMLSQVGSRWPVILNNGNHEHLTLDDETILKKTFEVYGSIQKRLTILHLPFINLFMLDPYKIVFKQEDPAQLLKQFEEKLKILAAQQPSKPIITCSHYPYRCNGNIPDCFDIRQKLNPFFNKMMQYNVALYMGGHYHTYERVYPYYYNDTFKKVESPYTWTEGGASNYLDNTLLSIVEGIAGNDREIIMQYPPDEPFTAAHVIGNTGFGIMTIAANFLTFDHVINKNPYNALDHWQIRFQRKNLQPNNLRKKKNLRIQGKIQ